MGMLSILGALSPNGISKESMSAIFGGEDPNPKKGKVFKTQAEIDAANTEAQRIAKLGSHADWRNVRVASKIGDPVPRYIDAATGKDSVVSPASKKRYTVPNEIGLSDIKSEGEVYWYNDPKTGDVVEVDKSVVNLPRFRTDKKSGEKNLADRGKSSILGLNAGNANTVSSIFGGATQK